MNIHRATYAEIYSLYRKRARWVCIAAYAHSGYEKGSLITWHRTYDAAARSAGRSQMRGLVELDYVETTDKGTFHIAKKHEG